MTHLAPTAPAARAVLRSTAVLALACALTVAVLIVTASAVSALS